MNLIFRFFWLTVLFFCFCNLGVAKPLPRLIWGLYDGSTDQFEFTPIHQFAEMPLNHLGLIVIPVDITKGLPALKNHPEVRGILSWFSGGFQHKNPVQFLDWARRAVLLGKRFVILGEPGFRPQSAAEHGLVAAVDQFFAEMGIRDLDEWNELTYNQRFPYEDPQMMYFERKKFQIKPAFEGMEALSPTVTSHLVIQSAQDHNLQSHLIMTGPKGGYAATGYALFYQEGEDGTQVRRWYLNPFEFFRLSFGTDDLPKPDITTLAGRRIFYSHIDGDGWNNVSYLETYRHQHKLSAEVIYEKILKPYPEIPVSVTAIAADLDPEWAGSEQADEAAREIFALPQVEIGSHTYSHPFMWGFFASGDPNKELPYLHKYKGGGWGKPKVVNELLSLFFQAKKKQRSGEGQGSKHHHDLPRAFAHEPFDLDKEITGAVDYIERFAPKGKKVKIIMWSGDTSPFEEAIRKSREAGLANINGGDSRMDRRFPSYAWVAPIGRKVGKEQQIYSSNSNENTYTDLWTGGFQGFRYLANTVKNTEQPIRISPFNIYYHFYSGEKQASYLALVDNLELAKREKLTRIWASTYSKIAQGFFHTKLISLGVNRWQILHRGELQTIRFDRASTKQVDYPRSVGVIGHHYFQGSLYVYLDKAVSKPILALKPFSFQFDPAPGTKANLDSATWVVSQLKRQGLTKVSFVTHGFGPGEFSWRLDPRYRWSARRSDPGSLKITTSAGRVKLVLSPNHQPVVVTLSGHLR